MKSKRVNFGIALVMAIALWVFVFVGEETLYLMTDYDSWFVRLPDGGLNNGPEAYWEKPVRIIHAELTIKN